MNKIYQSKKFIVFIDWGTTNFRAYKFDLNKNKVGKKIQTNQGILKLRKSSEYIKIIKSILRKFDLNEDQDILMAGMVGSKKGLCEAPYVQIPASLSKIALNIFNKQILKQKISIVPGLFYKKNNFYDVLRGEETLAIGAINKFNKKTKYYLCCPGTHSKWMIIQKDMFLSFSSYMSGELYSAIANFTILAQSLNKSSSKISEHYFTKGLKMIQTDQPISNTLFKVRTMDLFNQSNSNQCNSFLSGLIIGLEINYISKIKDLKKSSVILIANGPLTKLYSICFKFFKIKFSLVNADECFIRGMKKIYEANYK
tara:strand:- start:5305 stop:6240 length:936 start_codon:yes stop_codon:yes gene_type:complete